MTARGAMALAQLAAQAGPVAAFGVAAACLGASVPLLRGMVISQGSPREPAVAVPA